MATIITLIPSFKNLIYVNMGQGESTSHIERFKSKFAKIIRFIGCDINEKCVIVASETNRWCDRADSDCTVTLHSYVMNFLETS
jgi:hypothetical protein